MRFRTLLLIAATIACIPAYAEKVVLGKLGQALAASAIYRRPSPRSHVYYHVKPYEYLVVQRMPSKNYYKVLLQTGTYGYIPAEEVAQLPYDVTAERDPVATSGRSYAMLSSRSRAAVANYSLNFQGTPYKWGGNDPRRGIDCSGFVKYLYGQIGLNLPRTAAQQVRVGQPIKRLEELQAGDRLYFWSSKRGMIGHTGIYLGGGYFCHSSSNHKGVATDFLSSKWQAMLVAARR